MNSEKISDGPSWSVVVMVLGPGDSTVVRLSAPKDNHSFWELPNGENIPEDKQSPHRTAVRVLKEKTGFDLKVSDFQLARKRYVLKNKTTHVVYMFLVSVHSFYLFQQQKAYKYKEDRDGRLMLVGVKTVSKMQNLFHVHRELVNKLGEGANHIATINPNLG